MTSHVHRQGDLILLCQCYPKGSTDSTQSLSKSQHRNRKTHPQVHMESRGNPNSQNNLEKLEKSWWTHTLILKLIKLIKTVWYWHQDIQTDQGNRPERPEINHWIDSQMILTRGPRPFNGERTIFSTNGSGKAGYSQAEEWGWTPPYTIYKNQLKMHQT